MNISLDQPNQNAVEHLTASNETVKTQSCEENQVEIAKNESKDFEDYFNYKSEGGQSAKVQIMSFEDLGFSEAADQYEKEDFVGKRERNMTQKLVKSQPMVKEGQETVLVNDFDVNSETNQNVAEDTSGQLFQQLTIPTTTLQTTTATTVETTRDRVCTVIAEGEAEDETDSQLLASQKKCNEKESLEHLFEDMFKSKPMPRSIVVSKNKLHRRKPLIKSQSMDYECESKMSLPLMPDVVIMDRETIVRSKVTKMGSASVLNLSLQQEIMDGFVKKADVSDLDHQRFSQDGW